MTEAEARYHTIGRAMTDATESQLFGKPCFKVNNKAFICFFENEMVFKLTDDAYTLALSFDGAHLFDPSGKNRPMKAWVQVPFDYADQWANLANDAEKYVRSL